MNPVQPKKLLHSKWTAVSPVQKEKHFMVTKVEFDENGEVIVCEIEAVLSQCVREIQWQSLKDQTIWRQGWQ